ncbi:MAG: thioredoxin family protein [Marinoscillum sp.]
MSLTPSSMMPLGTKAPEFELTNVVNGKQLSFNDTRGAKGTVVMFICAHCPYVLHVQEEIVRIADKYQDKGVDFVAISSNDVENYPQDNPEMLKEQADSLGFNFPYLFDDSQEVAKAYGAECTPDFFMFDENNTCVYRGRMDQSTPGNNMPNDGADLRRALDDLIAGNQITGDQFPSMGCNIKWK